MPKLEDYTPEQLVDLPFEEIKDLRLEAFERRAKAMVTDAISGWATDMSVIHKNDKVLVHFNHPMSWIAALAIVRYGEALDHWPPMFSSDDEKRAGQWFTGKLPYGIRYLPQA